MKIILEIPEDWSERSAETLADRLEQQELPEDVTVRLVPSGPEAVREQEAWLREQADLREKSVFFMDDDPELAEESKADVVMLRAAADSLAAFDWEAT